MREALYDPYLDDEDDGDLDDLVDLEIDPEEQWDAWQDSLTSPPTKFAGDAAVVIEPVEPVYDHDRYGRMTTSLCFKMVPHVPADTTKVLVFVVDDQHNVTLAGNHDMGPPDGHDGGIVRVDGLFPHETWVLSEEEEAVTLVMLYFGPLTDPDALIGLEAYEDTAAMELEDLVSFIDWVLNFPDSGQALHLFRIEEADEILSALGWS